MDFEITQDRRNELLRRREVEYTLRFSGPTPSRVQIGGKLAAVLNVNEKHLALDSLRTRYGRMELHGKARIYDNADERQKTERSYILSRGIPKPKEEAA